MSIITHFTKGGIMLTLTETKFIDYDDATSKSIRQTNLKGQLMPPDVIFGENYFTLITRSGLTFKLEYSSEKEFGYIKGLEEKLHSYSWELVVVRGFIDYENQIVQVQNLYPTKSGKVHWSEDMLDEFAGYGKFFVA